jgi:iron complex transport system substrate-binding protein
MQRFKSLSILCLIALAGLSLAACGDVPIRETATSPPADVTLVDALGNTVHFDQPPQRIAIAGKSALTVADAAFMFPEARERVVALGQARQNVADFLQYVDPALDQKMLLEVEAGAEQIAAAQPDAVILKSYMAQSLGATLDELGVPVVYVDLETPEQYFRDIDTLGILFGDPARAGEIRAFFQSRLDRVSESLQGLDAAQKPRVLMLQWSVSGGDVAFFVPPASWIQTLMVELAGADPVWKEMAEGGGWRVVNFEQIAAWDPDVIVVIDYSGDSTQAAAGILGDSDWQMLSAVRNGQVFGFPADFFSWDQPDPRWVLGLSWLAGKLHPESYSRDMQAEINQFYSELYAMSPEAIDAHVQPKLTGDVD